MKDQVNDLLKQVAFTIATLKEARNRFSDRLAPEFSIFDYLRTDEMGLSRCIASLLDPIGKHGQKEAFLELFLEKINWPTNMKISSIELEKQANGQRRIDIYLRFENGKIIGIENKPWAGDQKNQLSDYAAFIEKEAGGNQWLLIYLNNNDPSSDSGIKDKQRALENEGKFFQLSFSAIIEWLNECACKSRALVVRLFIEELANFIRSNVNGELDMSEENEIKNIVLFSPETFTSAFHISLAMTKVKETILEEFHNDLKEKLADKGFELIWKCPTKGLRNLGGFGVKFDEEQNLYLYFEFQSSELNNLIWGIKSEKEFNNNDDAIWARVNELMNDNFGHAKRSRWWPWWSYIDKKEFSQAYRNWHSSEAPWIAIREKKLAEEITELSVRVHNVFSGNLALMSVKRPMN
ncbi:PD-(D/E)XK nuclease family protein [Nitrosomonas sp. ANs5]|uniref:PDDEXK-like family protein n=1 Tax=Nitrosomonas sp. ANs5 TaxID=3423941 RepID=UPI003D345C80